MNYSAEPPTDFGSFDDFFAWSTVDDLGFQVDEGFCLSDFFDSALDESLWLDPVGIDELISPDAAQLSPTGAPSNNNIIHPSNQGHGTYSCPVASTQVEKKRNVSRPLSEPDWDEILAIVRPLYLEKSLKQIQGVIPEMTGFAPRSVFSFTS